MKPLTFILLLSVFISSCGRPNPETILGIKLGASVKDQKRQISGVLNKKKFPTPSSDYNPDWEFTILSDNEHHLESYVTIFQCTDKDGNDIVMSVMTAIINPDVHHIADWHPSSVINPWTQYINEQDGQWLTKIFQDKYGETEIVKVASTKGYWLEWKKRNLNIKLSVSSAGYSGNQYLFHARVNYTFPDDVLHSVCPQTKPGQNF